jgi:phosphoribosylaminoimidazole-succinocarboxamide synthase
MSVNQFVLGETDLPLKSAGRGKVRDTYDLGKELLIIVSDRVSAFDVVFPGGIPDKGRVLTQISAFWFEKTASLMPNHVIKLVDDPKILDEYLAPERRFAYPDYLSGRSMVVKKAKVIPIECVVRGYISGSGWSDYQKTGAVAEIVLPSGLKESDMLAEPIFTPTSKADTGHDMPMTYREVEDAVGVEAARELKEKSLAIYNYARDYARERDIIIADTKFEFGYVDGQIIVIDEMLTPDSSRFWDAKRYQPGKSQPSYDKQPVRDWAEGSGWDKTPPAPELPDEVISTSTTRYREAYSKLTGRELD